MITRWNRDLNIDHQYLCQVRYPDGESCVVVSKQSHRVIERREEGRCKILRNNATVRQNTTNRQDPRIGPHDVRIVSEHTAPPTTPHATMAESTGSTPAAVRQGLIEKIDATLVDILDTSGEFVLWCL